MAAWRLFAGFGVIVTAAFLLAPADSMGQAVLGPMLAGAAAAALVLGVRRHRPRPAWAWRLLTGATAVYALASPVWALYPFVMERPLPFPSILDPMYWAAYLGWFVFLVVVVRINARGAGAVIDALVIAGGVAVVGWETLIEPSLDADLPTAVAVAALTYPVLLTMLVGVAVRAAMTPLRATVVHVLLVAWIGLELVGDVWYGLAIANGTFHFGSPWSATWLLSYTALGALGLHPRLPELTQAPVVDRHVARWRQIVVLTVAGLAPMVVLLTRNLTGETPRSDAYVIRAISMVIFVAIMVRLGKSSAHLASERELRGQLEHAAVHDALTGLANRVGVHEALRRALGRRHKHDRAAMVMLADLDGFKAVNDTYGHDAGDELLREVARRLSDGVRAGDTVGRLGGDEFAVVIDDIDLAEGLALADRLAASIAGPIELDGATPTMGVSLGVYRAEHGDDPNQALRHADAAMYAAKNAGGGVELYDAERHRGFLDRYRLDLELRAAPAAGQLVLHYQPIYRLSERCIVAAEALVRWQHPERGWLLPGAFIQLAEDSGAILDIDRWVLHQACRAAASWQRDADGVGVAVNLSRRHLQDSAIVADVADALAASGLPPHLLTIEITETAVTDDIDSAIHVMQELKTLGVDLAMDDFGTGYSSLADLRRMPVDVLKIDRAFVAGITHTEEEWALATAIIRLASSLGKRTLAEGIEEAGQLAHLRSLGCELGQGYLFASPMSGDDLVNELERNSVTAG